MASSPKQISETLAARGSRKWKSAHLNFSQQKGAPKSSRRPGRPTSIAQITSGCMTYPVLPVFATIEPGPWQSFSVWAFPTVAAEVRYRVVVPWSSGVLQDVRVVIEKWSGGQLANPVVLLQTTNTRKSGQEFRVPQAK